MGVFLAYVSARGHTRISRELYLPLDWTEDRERGLAAGIPESVRFQSKAELARRLVARLWNAQIPLAWVVADTLYGGNLDLRSWLEDQAYPYVLAVACNEPVGILTADGVRRRVEAAQVATFLLAAQEWQRLWMSEGSKGPSRLQTGPADALLVGFALGAPSYLQALAGHDGVFDACQSGAHGCQTAI